MKVVAYDPYVSPRAPRRWASRCCRLDELLEVSDFITVHLPKTPETRRPDRRRGAAQGQADRAHHQRRARRHRRRGGAVLGAQGGPRRRRRPRRLREGAVHGLPAVRVRPGRRTPHLGASTDEAQEKAGIAVARSVRLALAGELVPDAVNVQGGVIAEDVKPGLPLAEKLGRIFTALAGEVAVRLDVEVYGEITQHDVKVLELSALKGVFEDVVDETVSYVNAPLFAQERGVEVRLTTARESPDHRNVVTVRGTLSNGEEVSVSGTLAGPKHLQKIVAVGEYDVDLALADHMVVLRYEDRPGVVGTVGRILGEAGINIAGMQVAVRSVGGEALAVLTVDDTVPPGCWPRLRRRSVRPPPGRSTWCDVRGGPPPAPFVPNGLVLKRRAG